MLELIFQGFMEWAYSLTLECWQYFSSALLDIMSLDFAYLKTHVPVIGDIMQILLAVGWALLIGNLVFQALKSMASGLGFEGEDPKILFARTFVFAFLLLASPQICCFTRSFQMSSRPSKSYGPRRSGSISLSGAEIWRLRRKHKRVLPDPKRSSPRRKAPALTWSRFRQLAQCQRHPLQAGRGRAQA